MDFRPPLAPVGRDSQAPWTNGEELNRSNGVRDALAPVTKLSFAKAYAKQCGGSTDDAVKMRTTQQLDDDLLAGQVCLHRNGLPLLP